MKIPLKLHLGCGDIKLDKWVNIDWTESPYTDLVDDVSNLNKFEENSVDEIYACHILEHFGLDHNIEQPHCVDVLTRWNKILKPNGILYVSVPNLLSLMRGLKDNYNNISNTYDILRCCFGGQDYKGNTHYCGFTEPYLKYLLERTGYCNISTFEPFVRDTSVFNLHGVNVSINLKAHKL
jgi:hypothetical protein